MKRRKIVCSTVSILERVWMAKRLKSLSLYQYYPGVSGGVIFRALETLHTARLVRTYWSPARNRPGRPPRFWTPTQTGLHLLRVLIPYRDIWELIDNRDLIVFAKGVKLLERLERNRIDIFPGGRQIDPRSNYMRKSNLLWHEAAQRET